MHDFLRLLLSLLAEWNLPFCEDVRVACVDRLCFVPSSIFVDLLSVFRLPFKRSLSVRCTFNARFALNENGKVLFN